MNTKEKWVVQLVKTRSTWNYVTFNPSGGSFGSSLVGTKKRALHRATENIPDGEQYALNVNGKITIERK